MSIFVRLCEKNIFSTIKKPTPLCATYVAESQAPRDSGKKDSDGFRILMLKPEKAEKRERTELKFKILPPRETRMKVDQDWPSVWPGPRTFHPATVPLPIRQGYPLRNQAPFGKYANAELMKIPNFLHLTPPAVRRHCEAIKKFCTKWPVGLETEEKCTKHFPMEVITSDYVFSSPTIREPLARIVSLRVKVSSLTLDRHAKDKLLRLVKDKYDPETDYITITTDRCPMKKQNMDYVQYLITALYHESWKVEPWEAEKSEADMEYYDWDTNKSRENLISLLCWPEPPKDIDYQTVPHAVEYKMAVTDLINNGEDEHSVDKYKEAVKNLLNLK
ncbi:28S ribosomal protein S35, mitochondrial [Leptopilina heterotoma]|uniref:28S ribosomal protein S35, mitochondrial n=1 Tax=Leptopilina heterotoma TaxID=63436 RepID=UPI001CA7D66F|nr:28S ribosomal protein S35, mitochondrial [Leptopilina heterotoma]